MSFAEPDVVSRVFIDADELDHFIVCDDALLHSDGPRLGIRLGIVDSDFDFQVTVIRPAESLHHLCGISQWIADNIEPDFINETSCFNDQRISVPLSYRVAIPPGLRVRAGQWPPIQEDLPQPEI